MYSVLDNISAVPSRIRSSFRTQECAPVAERLKVGAHFWLHALSSLFRNFEHEHLVKLSRMILWRYIWIIGM